MNVHVSAEQEALLADLAHRTGRKVEDLVHDVIDYLVTDKARFLEAVEKGMASLDRGEFVTHEEVQDRLERIFRS